MQSLQSRKGFTLVELIIVVAILSGLALLVFVAINPLKRMTDARQAEMQSNAEQMTKAINLQIVDTFAIPPGIDDGEVLDICKQTITDPSCINLGNLVTEGYIGSIPVTQEYSDPIHLVSGYQIVREGGSVRVCPRSQCYPSGGSGTNGPAPAPAPSPASSSEGTTAYSTTIDSIQTNNGGYVHAFATYNGITYVGGEFTTIAGQPRNRLAAFDSTGNLTSWDPGAAGGPNGPVRSLSADASGVYVGGIFTIFNGQTRNRMAKVDHNGTLLSWDPNVGTAVGDSVYVMQNVGNTLYIGGRFTSVSAQPHVNLAAIDTTTGTPLSWSADAMGGTEIRSMKLYGSTLYVGGLFDGIGGQLRKNAAAIDITSGGATVLPWQPDPDSYVLGIAVDANRVYLGGYFKNLNSVPVQYLTSVTKTTGAIDATWTPPGLTSVVIRSMDLAQGVVYIGGAPFWTGAGGNPKLVAGQPTQLVGLSTTDAQPVFAPPDVIANGVWGFNGTHVAPGIAVFAGSIAAINGQAHLNFARFPALP